MFNITPSELINENNYLVLYAILLTNNYQKLNGNCLINHCKDALLIAISKNIHYLLIIIKTLNLLLKKFNTYDIDIELQYIYYCLENPTLGVREETLTLVNFCTKDLHRSTKFFKIVYEFWPWSNKNKFYLISSILNNYNLLKIQELYSFDLTQFFYGLRIALSYKNLFASSQYLVRSLSNQNNLQLLELAIDIITKGSISEIYNFYSQWFSRISQKYDLFQLLRNEEIFISITSFENSDDLIVFRKVFIGIMFTKQIINFSQDLFSSLCNYFKNNCFKFAEKTQLLIFKLISENLNYLNLENSLKFIINFIKKHKTIDNSRFRNSVLSKLTLIINFLSKTYNKDKSSSPTLKILNSFFKEIHEIIIIDVFEENYQLKIFALKTLDILLKALYAPTVVKNAKNCNLQQNQQFGMYLINEQVFDADWTQNSMFQILQDPTGYDDARELIVSILETIKFKHKDRSLEMCNKFCIDVDIDRCALASLYAKIAMNCCNVLHEWNSALKLFDDSIRDLRIKFELFKKDPFHFLNTNGHIFGYLNVINEVIFGSSRDNIPMHKFREILELIDKIICDILKKLSIAIQRDNFNSAASFQDIDISLEILITTSNFKALESNQRYRKYLLMSFWLTLKVLVNIIWSTLIFSIFL